MQDVTRHAARLLEQAQAGGAAAALARAEFRLRERTGDLSDGPAAMHFVRVVALVVLGDVSGSLAAADLMLHAADREGSVGWRACALATRASRRLRLREVQIGEHDVDAALRDLATAEATLALGEPCPVATVNARVGIAVGYHSLRLYELAGPQYQAAYEISSVTPGGDGNRAMWLTNLAYLHLEWALELYQVHQDADAEKHTAEAEGYALRAADESSGPDAPVWRDGALLAAACARADRDDPAGAAKDITRYLTRLEARGLSRASLVYCRPFHAVALQRSGRPDEALRTIEAAVTDLPPDTEWVNAAATRRTHAVLLVAQGHTDARAGLAYGDTLAAALWQQRLRSLHTATALQSYEVLRNQHDLAARAAETDALTGVANRRGLDRWLTELPGRVGDNLPVAALVVDLDRFKAINDSRGHAEGDRALQAVAAALTGTVREGDLVARLGGDEFCVLLPGIDRTAATGIARRMVSAVRAVPDGLARVSIGVAAGPAGTVRDTLERADRVMYRVKQAGGDAVGDDPA